MTKWPDYANNRFYREPPGERCPKCGSTNMKNFYGGERGEGQTYIYCYDCDYDEEEERKDTMDISNVIEERATSQRPDAGQFAIASGLIQIAEAIREVLDAATKPVKETGYDLGKPPEESRHKG